MSLSINWNTKVITIPQSYLTYVSGSVYKLDVNQFRLDLKDIEDSEEGIPFLDTHRHNTEVTIGGMTLARVVEIINGYSITFENGQYIVNLVGANNNILDVTNLNQVSIRSSNSAGMIVSGSGILPSDIEDIADAVWDEIMSGHINIGSFGEALKIIKAIETGRWKIDTATNMWIAYDQDGQTELISFMLKNASGQPSSDDVYERVPT